MSIVRQSLAIAFTLTVAGAAFARNPPALVRAQHTGEGLGASSGYRGAFAERAGGASAYAAAGYRDSNARLNASTRVGGKLAFAPKENQAMCPTSEPSRC